MHIGGNACTRSSLKSGKRMASSPVTGTNLISPLPWSKDFVWGWKGALIKGIEIRQAQRKTGYSSASNIALLYADVGDKDQAFRWLNTAYQERDWLLQRLKTYFLFDPLRSDPRFAELVRKVGLPQ
jgi:hypothetical protein